MCIRDSVVADPAQVVAAVKEHYGEDEADAAADGAAFDEILKEMGVDSSDDGKIEVEDIEQIDVSGDERDIAAFVDAVLVAAIGDRASDIHFEPFENDFKIRARVDGALYELTSPPRSLAPNVVGRIKVMADLITYETDLPQEGRAPASPDYGNVELRVSIFPTVRGEKIVVRLFDPQNRSFDLETLGFESGTIESFKKLIRQPSGLILLNGPTGSGKTTAIYSALCHLIDAHGPTISISTVEDPVEFNLPIISQSQISNSRGFTYPKALRSLMRQDPEAVSFTHLTLPTNREV